METPPAVPEMPSEMPVGGGEGMAPPIPEEPMSDEMPAEAPEEPSMEGEGDDKKKEIQKLTGELSELLRTYNQENGEDEELNKYVKGMIDAQTDGESDGEEPESEEPMGDEEMPAGEEEGIAPPIPEGRTFTKKQLKEEFGVKVDDNVEPTIAKQPKKKTISKSSPFNPPMFK